MTILPLDKSLRSPLSSQEPQSYVLRAVHPISVPLALLLPKLPMPVSAIHFQKLCGLAWSARLVNCPLKPCAITAPGLGPLWSACLCLPPVLVSPAFPQVCPLGASYSDCLGSYPSHLAEVRDLVPLSGSGVVRKQVLSEWTNRRKT